MLKDFQWHTRRSSLIFAWVCLSCTSPTTFIFLPLVEARCLINVPIRSPSISAEWSGCDRLPPDLGGPFCIHHFISFHWAGRAGKTHAVFIILYHFIHHFISFHWAGKTHAMISSRCFLMFLDFALESIDMKRGLPFCRCHLLLCRHCKGGDGMAGAGRSRDML